MPDTTASPRIFQESLCAPASRKFILVAAVLASAMGFIDSSVVSIAMPAMRTTLGASLAQAQWISGAYLLTLSALILAGGAFGDRFGLARVFGAGIAAFVAASILCALAPDAEFLIAARSLQGIAAAFMVPGSLAIIARAYPRAERGRAIGIWAAAASSTTAIGPVLGGLALTFGGAEMWRLVFWINLPLGLLALGMLWRFVEADRRQSDRRLDIMGALLATAGLGLIAWGLVRIETGQAASWLSVAAGAGFLAVFVVWEARTRDPMMPVWLFRLPGFAAANLATLILFTGFVGILFFLPMSVISAWGISELEAAATVFPLAVFMAGLSAWSGRMADRVGAGQMIVAGSATVAVAFAVLGAGFGLRSFWLHVLPSMSLMGLGMGLLVSPLSTAVMTAAPDENSGIASGINNAIARAAGLIAVAALGAVAAIAYRAAGGAAGFGIAAEVAGHGAATDAAFRAVAYAASVLAAAAALVAHFGIPKKPR